METNICGNFRCVHCTKTFDKRQNILDHLCKHHPNQPITFQCKALHETTGRLGYLRKLYKELIPSELQAEGKLLKADDQGEILVTINHSDNTPHHKKKVKATSPRVLENDISFENKNSFKRPQSHRKLQFDSPHELENDISSDNNNLTSFDCTPDEIPSDDADALIVKDLIPKVIENLRESGQLSTYRKFCELIAKKKLPLDNICYLLFLDVVEFLSNENLSAMRYIFPQTLQFWRVGYRLFKGKFLRFMGGPKNSGQIIQNDGVRGYYDPCDSKINFAIPNRQRLCKEDSSIRNINPGIFYEHIEQMSHIYDGKVVKLAADGKKIARGRGKIMGDIDCWGFEKSPTLCDRQECFQNDIESIDTLFALFDENFVVNITSLDENLKAICLSKIKEDVHRISVRLADLRAMILSIQRSTAKFMAMGGDNWRKSRYYFVISCLRTTKYDAETAVDEGLCIVNKLMSIGSHLTGKENLYAYGATLNLDQQDNYMPLKDDGGEIDNPTSWRYIHQRTEKWFEVRKLARVTGSTCHAALGLDTLKRQQRHYDKVVQNRDSEVTISNEQMDNMQYGTDHEIHAVATIVAKVMPVFYPNLTFFEEGCVGIHHNESPFFVSSPDGSMRTFEDHAPVLMCEIKCKPGNPNTMPVYYELPRYYVMQVLSEMAAYDSPKLLFACWSEKSTVVLEVLFDRDLWDKAWNQLVFIYEAGNEHRPSKIRVEIHQLKEAVVQFSKTSCKLLGEFPSINDLGQRTETSVVEYSTETVLKELLSTKRWIENAYQLTRKEATEVLVFMVNDLDRQFHAELINSTPIAYAMKGPSLSCSQFRQMMDYVIEKCSEKDVNILITSADGQWHNYGVRDNTNRPLTLLQLQRDVWNDTKSKQKSVILRELKSTNVVDITKIEQCVLYEKSVKGNLDVWGNMLYGPLPKITPSLYKKYTSERRDTSKDVSRSVTEDTDEANLDAMINSTNDHFDMESIIAIENALDARQIPVSTNTTMHTDSLPDAVGDALQALYTLRSEDSLGMESQVIPEIMDIDDHAIYVDQFDAMNLESYRQDQQFDSTHQNVVQNRILDINDVVKMKDELSKNPDNNRSGWDTMSVDEFGRKFSTGNTISSSFTKKELVTCLRPVMDKLKANGTRCAVSWTKSKLATLFSKCLGDNSEAEVKARRHRTPLSLKQLSLKVISSKYPKELLNVVMAEYSWLSEMNRWYSILDIEDNLKPVRDISSEFGLSWFSKPNSDGKSVRFHFTDSCHILTCIRTKVCTNGIYGLRKSAWRNAALSSSTKLNISLIDECVDKQSVSFAKTVFAIDVQEWMIANGYEDEALFCKLIHDWFSAEDDPGISAIERCFKRLKLRQWLLDGIDFGNFPPKTGYIKGIPIVTYEGLLVNIERKLQMFPYCKEHCYNVRATGTQEIEQFFGTFRDMDPSGSGTPKPDDIPLMFGRAVEICNCRFDSTRSFYMATSTATVYPEVIYSTDTTYSGDRSNTQSQTQIRDHFFDTKERTRVERKNKKRCSISSPHKPSRGERGVRQFHRADESKVLPHLRRGLPDLPQ